MRRRWVIATPDAAVVERLRAELRLPRPLAAALVNRGFHDPASAASFLNPRLADLRDPFELPAMAAAVKRVVQALAQQERIVVYGDYDVDGVTSSALLTSVLRAAGGTVEPFLPHRMDEGYGLSAEGVARCVEQCRPQLLIAVDCGTTAVAEIAALTRQGVDVIVLDHHEPPAELPVCVALVNPKVLEDAVRGSPDSQSGRPVPGNIAVGNRSHGEGSAKGPVAVGNRSHTGQSDEEPVTPLASVGVTFKLAHALLKELPAVRARVDLRDYLELVAVGTIADLVPLTGENRLLTRTGLERLAGTRQPGLRALLEVAGVRGAVRPYDVGFRLGPRLNAAGRLADAMAALELLLTADCARAGELAGALNDHNAERQQIEKRVLAAALAQARTLGADRVLVLADDTWHAGVIGIVASRVLQEFYRPTVVIGAGGKGSCRSVSGFSIVAALGTCTASLEKFGGHEMAAGLTVRAGRIDELRRQLNVVAAAQLQADQLTPSIAVDAEFRLDELTAEFFEWLARFEPCGIGNPAPCFVVRGVRLRGAARVLAEKHLKFNVTDGRSVTEVIWWGAAGTKLPERFDVVCQPEISEYRGVETMRLRVRDLREAGEGEG